MSNYRHLETDRWADLESDPTDAVFGESFSDLPWELRDPEDFPTQDQTILAAHFSPEELAF